MLIVQNAVANKWGSYESRRGQDVWYRVNVLMSSDREGLLECI